MTQRAKSNMPSASGLTNYQNDAKNSDGKMKHVITVTGVFTTPNVSNDCYSQYVKLDITPLETVNRSRQM